MHGFRLLPALVSLSLIPAHSLLTMSCVRSSSYDRNSPIDRDGSNAPARQVQEGLLNDFQGVYIIGTAPEALGLAYRNPQYPQKDEDKGGSVAPKVIAGIVGGGTAVLAGGFVARTAMKSKTSNRSAGSRPIAKTAPPKISTHPNRNPRQSPPTRPTLRPPVEPPSASKHQVFSHALRQVIEDIAGPNAKPQQLANLDDITLQSGKRAVAFVSKPTSIPEAIGPIGHFATRIDKDNRQVVWQTIGSNGQGKVVVATLLEDIQQGTFPGNVAINPEMPKLGAKIGSVATGAVYGAPKVPQNEAIKVELLDVSTAGVDDQTHAVVIRSSADRTIAAMRLPGTANIFGAFEVNTPSGRQQITRMERLDPVDVMGMPTDELTTFTEGIAKTLADLEDIGVPHGDLRLENVQLRGKTPVLVNLAGESGTAFSSDADRQALARMMMARVAPEALHSQAQSRVADFHNLAQEYGYTDLADSSMPKPNFGQFVGDEIAGQRRPNLSEENGPEWVRSLQQFDIQVRALLEMHQQAPSLSAMRERLRDQYGEAFEDLFNNYDPQVVANDRNMEFRLRRDIAERWVRNRSAAAIQQGALDQELLSQALKQTNDPLFKRLIHLELGKTSLREFANGQP